MIKSFYNIEDLNQIIIDLSSREVKVFIVYQYNLSEYPSNILRVSTSLLGRGISSECGLLILLQQLNPKIAQTVEYKITFLLPQNTETSIKQQLEQVFKQDRSKSMILGG